MSTQFKLSEDEDDLIIPDFLRRSKDAPHPLKDWWMKDRGQREWAPIRHNTAPTPNMPRLSVPKPPKQTGAQGVGRAGTDAEKVRNFIREAMANNGTKEQVIDRVVKELNFAVPKAKTYVNGNWAKLEGLNKK